MVFRISVALCCFVLLCHSECKSFSCIWCVRIYRVCLSRVISRNMKGKEQESDIIVLIPTDLVESSLPLRETPTTHNCLITGTIAQCKHLV